MPVRVKINLISRLGVRFVWPFLYTVAFLPSLRCRSPSGIQLDRLCAVTHPREWQYRVQKRFPASQRAPHHNDIPCTKPRQDHGIPGNTVLYLWTLISGARFPFKCQPPLRILHHLLALSRTKLYTPSVRKLFARTKSGHSSFVAGAAWTMPRDCWGTRVERISDIHRHHCRALGGRNLSIAVVWRRVQKSEASVNCF